MKHKFLIVLAHPEPKSFCGALRDKCLTTLKALGHEIKESDLYKMKFNPLLDKGDFTKLIDPTKPLNLLMEQKTGFEKKTLAKDVQDELTKLLWCDYLICIAPYWWGTLPAMMKGWFDRVLVCGGAWDFGKYFGKGPLLGKKAMLITTTGGPEEAYKPGAMHGMTLDDRLHHVTYGTFAFCGMTPLPTMKCWAVGMVPPAKREQYLKDLESTLKDIDKLKPMHEVKTF